MSSISPMFSFSEGTATAPSPLKKTSSQSPPLSSTITAVTSTQAHTQTQATMATLKNKQVAHLSTKPKVTQPVPVDGLETDACISLILERLNGRQGKRIYQYPPENLPKIAHEYYHFFKNMLANGYEYSVENGEEVQKVRPANPKEPGEEEISNEEILTNFGHFFDYQSSKLSPKETRRGAFSWDPEEIQKRT